MAGEQLKNSKKRESFMGFLKKLGCILGWREKAPQTEAPLYPDDPVELFYICGIDYSESYDKLNHRNCAVIERTADGKSVGICCFNLQDGTTCPRHGTVKEEVVDDW